MDRQPSERTTDPRSFFMGLTFGMVLMYVTLLAALMLRGKP